MRTQVQPDMHESNSTDTRAANDSVGTSGGTPTGMLWGEAFRHAPFADNLALIEAMGSHFDPASTRRTR